ncbi:hypothetical protein V1517DRAFT_311244 [Lipomyces orientalis]|uniref:Uncharacterized protein n=1 Tax=Lipomyces orientalis TaxID=1233043 RepID=A0ACC3TD56_9ASCO
MARVQSLSAAGANGPQKKFLLKVYEPPLLSSKYLLVRLQAVTRKRARIATQGEDFFGEKTAEGLLGLIRQLQREDPLCLRLIKEIERHNSRKSYALDQDGLLKYKNRKSSCPTAKGADAGTPLFILFISQAVGALKRLRSYFNAKFYWLQLTNDAREYVLTCPTCQNVAIPRHKPYGKLESLPIPRAPRPIAKSGPDRATEPNSRF